MIMSTYIAGVHAVCVWRSLSGGHSWAAGASLGPAKHGLRPAAEGIEPQVPDALYPLLPQQARLRPKLH